MPSRARAVALGPVLAFGLLIAGCGDPDATAPESTTVPSATASGTVATTSPSTASTGSATPAPTSTASASTSTGPESTATTGSSPTLPGDEDGTYGTDLAIVGSKLEFTPMRWYFGKDALARCKKLGIEPEGAWCNDFFFEEAGDRVSAAFADDVQIKVLTKNAKLKSGSRAQLNRAISESLWPHFQIRLVNGEAAEITQVYTP